MNERHPALVASQASWRCVQAHDKQGWLDLMADDVHIEDPIGAAVTAYSKRTCRPSGKTTSNATTSSSPNRPRITPAGLKESHPHDVQMVVEAPNYRR